MQLTYWILGGLLAVFYAWTGVTKMTRSQEKLAPMMAWAGTTIPMSGVRAIGAVEVLGALGLVLPPLTGIAPFLAVAAAVGFVVLQILATAFHVSRGETKDLWLNGVLIVLAAVAAWLATSF